MTAPTTTWAERQEEYWKAEGHEKAASQLVGTCWFVLICQTVFIGLDHWVFPEHFPFFVAMRLTVNFAIFGVLFWWRHQYPNASQIAVPIAVAIEILAMIYASGDSDSLYFAGLILVLVGIPVLQPISVRGSIAVSSICVGGFVLCAALAPGSVNEQAFVIELIFILAAGFESAVSCHALGINRVVAFEQRREIEATRDQLASLDEAKTRFSANVHHELRTPLTLILAPLETLRGGDLGDLSGPVERTLRTMHVNGQRLLKLINDLLDLAKLESDRFTIRRCQIDLYSLLEDIVVGAGPMAERKGICLSLSPRVGTPFASLDHDAVEKVVVNLVSNALKFTGAGGSVVVGLEPSSDGAELILRVRDTGVGLAEKDIGRIFDRFAQVDTSATREQEGTGIGLSLVKELVELHGGRVWAESDGVGLGSTMCVQFPVGEPDDLLSEEVTRSKADTSRTLRESLNDIGARVPTDNPEFQAGGITADLEYNIDRWESRRALKLGAEESDISSEKPNIVVADDNPDMRELLRFILGREFAVHIAQNGREALEQVERVNPDLVVTDIMMPEMTGIELCQALKTNPNTASTPLMLVSSKAESEMKVEGLDLGADDYVTKPFHPQELLARARGLVRLRVLQQEVEERNEALEAAMGELKATEIQLVRSERLAAVGELAAGVAHEVNNPLNFARNSLRTLTVMVDELSSYACAIGQLELDDVVRMAEQVNNLSDGFREIDVSELADDIKQLVEILGSGLDRTAALVADLRDFASPQQDEQGPFDLVETVRSTLKLTESTLRAAQIDVHLDIKDDVPLALGNRASMSQVILNVVKNSGDALADRGHGTIGVSVDQSSDADKLRLTISDDGPGIESEVVDRVFEPFFTTKTAGRGTGLGLAMCRRTMHECGGEIWIDSHGESGTRIVVEIPSWTDDDVVP